MIPLTLLAASAAEMQRCESVFTGPDQVVHKVDGFGLTEAEARHGSEQSARLLATLGVLKHGIRAWYDGDPNYQQPLIDSMLIKGTRSFAVPGWTLEPGACTSVEYEGAQSYTATWLVGGEEVHRPDPALAVEVARRRACLPAYQRNLMQIVDGVLREPESIGKLTLLNGAYDEMLSCWTGEAVVPAPSSKAIVYEAKPTRCTAIDGTGSSVAVGFGATSELAAEQAIRQSVIARTLRVISALADATDQPQDTRRASMENPLRSLVGMTGASDAVDRSRLACASVTKGPLTWRAKDKQTTKICNSSSWTERPRTPVEAIDAAPFLDGTCRLQINPTFEIVRFTGKSAPPEKQASIVAKAYEVTGACASTCYAEAVWGTEPTAIVLTGAPDRTTKKQVLQDLEPVIQGQSLSGLQLLPTLQDPQALGALLSGQIGAALKAEVRTLADKPERWRTIDGNWILLVSTDPP